MNFRRGRGTNLQRSRTNTYYYTYILTHDDDVHLQKIHTLVDGERVLRGTLIGGYSRGGEDEDFGDEEGAVCCGALL